MELAMSGVTAVGEFHYVHHFSPDGRPYAWPWPCRGRAAKDSGVRHAHPHGLSARRLRPGTRARATPLRRPRRHPVMDVDALRALRTIRWCVSVAAHSICAVPLADVVALADFAAARGCRFTCMWPSSGEELDECRAEYGLTPVALLADEVCCRPTLWAYRDASHPDEVMRLGQSGDGLSVSHHRAGPGRRPAPYRRVGRRGCAP
ncbi:MAG: hypothetical protein R2838_03425 [Caldilineaceae bacterium]